MKILVLVDNYPPEMNANARIISELAEKLAHQGFDLSVMTSHPNFPKGKIFPGHQNQWKNKTIRNGVTIHRVKTYMYSNQGKFRRTLDFISFGLSSFLFGLFQKKIDCIVGLTPQFFSALSACLLSIVKKKPFILILCDLWPDAIVSNGMISKGLIFDFLKKLEFFMYQRAHAIAILSPYFRKYLNQGNIDNSTIVEFISGADETFYPRAKEKNLLKHYKLKDKLVVGYIGTFGLSHNHEDIIDVFKTTCRDDLHLFMIGDGVKKEALEHSVEGLTNVTIDGPIQAQEVPAYWSVCDVFIVPLAPTEVNRTVMPSKILEGMKMGLPAILYIPEGEATRFFSPSEACWFLKSGHSEALKDFIETLSIEMIFEKKEKAQLFSENFSRANQSDIFRNTIHKVCSE